MQAGIGQVKFQLKRGRDFAFLLAFDFNTHSLYTAVDKQTFILC